MNIEEYRAQCLAWVQSELPLNTIEESVEWGRGSDDVSIFQSATDVEESEFIERGREWQQRRLSAGFGAITWPVEMGGAGLSKEHDQVYREIEANFLTP